MIYWFIQINLGKVVKEIIFYVVMTPVAMRIESKFIVAPHSFAREGMERTRIRQISYSYCGLPFLNCSCVSVTCTVLNVLFNSSFTLFLRFFSILILFLFIYAFIYLFVLITYVHFFNFRLHLHAECTIMWVNVV